MLKRITFCFYNKVDRHNSVSLLKSSNNGIIQAVLNLTLLNLLGEFVYVFGVKCWKPHSANPPYLIFRKFRDLCKILCTRFPASWNHKLSYDIIFVGTCDIADIWTFQWNFPFIVCSWLLNLSILRDNRAGVCLYLPRFYQCWKKCGTFSCQVVTDVMHLENTYTNLSWLSK